MDGSVECLSQAHKRAQEKNITSGHIPGDVVPAHAEVWRDATCVKARRETVWKECIVCHEPFEIEHWHSVKYDTCCMCRLSWHECEHCHIKFQVSGRELRQKVIICPSCGGECAGAVRGDVTRFSDESRRRLMEELNKLKVGLSRLAFVTLTFPDEYYPLNEDFEGAKVYLKRFEERFRRRFPGASYVWRLECEDRKSGAHIGALFPHFHLLVFGVKLVLLREFVAKEWHEIAGFGVEEHLKVHSHRKTVTPCVSRKAVLSYASKAVGAVMSRELSKTIQTTGGKVGRWWGTIAKAVFHSFQAQPETVELNDVDSVKVFRFFRGFMKGQMAQRYIKAVEKARKAKKALPRHPRKMRSRTLRAMTCFIDGGVFWGAVRSIVGSVGAWCFGATGREYSVPFWRFAYESGLLVPEMENMS